MRIFFPLVALLLILTPAVAFAEAAAPEAAPSTFAEALAKSKAALSLRYRFENVTDDALAKDAQASTLRTALSLKTASFHGFSLFLEAENLSAIFDDERYNNAGSGSLSNQVRDRPVVADPELTEMNQVYLAYQSGKASARLGRQELSWGDERFVGPVGWRQNHQSFDALHLDFKASETITVEYAYLARAHRIFGDVKDMSSHLLSVPVTFDGGRCRLMPYALYLDYDAPGDALLSTFTYGLEFKSGRDFAQGTKLAWEVEIARQSDVAGNRRHVDAGYYLAAASFGRKGLRGRLGYEVLEGSTEDGVFQTPLATLHKWNGWADKFLSTPPNGLEDRYVGFEGEAGTIGWQVVYHDFGAESRNFGRNLDYGSEVDAQLTWKSPWKQTMALKLASYDANAFSRDTDKWIFWTSYQF